MSKEIMNPKMRSTGVVYVLDMYETILPLAS